MRLWMVLGIAGLASAASVSLARAETAHAVLAVRVTVAPRCTVMTTGEGTVSLRCTRGSRDPQAALDGAAASAVRLTWEGRALTGTAHLVPGDTRGQTPFTLVVDF